MILLKSLLEAVDRKRLLELQSLLIESELDDAGWSFDISQDGLEVSNSRFHGHVALGPLDYGSCKGETDEERIADLLTYYIDADIPTVTAIIHSYELGSKSKSGKTTWDESTSTVVFPTARDAFNGALRYEGYLNEDFKTPYHLLEPKIGRFDQFVNTLLTAKNA